MIKLSQRAWNNVIIISMLILILLFNFSSNFLNGNGDETPAVLTLVPYNLTITTIEFAQDKIERIGQGWRMSSGNTDNDSLANLVGHWSNAQVRVIDTNNDLISTQPIFQAKVWFAGQEQPIGYAFYLQGADTLVSIDQQLYQLTSPGLHMLRIGK
jgi:hypothetical protein